MTEEYLDILDEEGNKTGEVKPKLEAHQQGLIHSAAHVWILNFQNEILIQKREKNKRFYPSHWDISAAGHISTGERDTEAAARETKEELGLDIPESNFVYLCTLRENSVFNDGAFVNREFNPVYVVKIDIHIDDIKLLDGEVEAIQFLSLEEFKKWTSGEREKMVPHEQEYRKLIEYLETHA